MEAENIQKARAERMLLARYISSKMNPNALLRGDEVVTYVFDEHESNQRKQKIKYLSYQNSGSQTLYVYPDGDLIDTESSCQWSHEMKAVLTDRLDALPLAYADPRQLRVPVVATKNLWCTVLMFSAADEHKLLDINDSILRSESHVREVHILTRRGLGPGAFHMRDYAGTLEYPFSLLDVRALVVAYMEANFENEDMFWQECQNMDHQEQATDFAEKYQIAMNGICCSCSEMQIDLSAAIPSVK